MKIPFGDLKKHYLGLKEEIDSAVQRVLDSGWHILGEEGRLFEQEFAAYCGVAHGVGVGSGTEALHLALVAAGVKPGDEVITVPNTAVPTISAISFAGATPRLVDIDPVTYTMDPAKIEAAISARTKAIIPVHLFGQCADLDPILAIANKNGITVIEDACQAHGARYKGKRAGSLGDYGCFSFYPSKNLGAFGDGGMIVTNSRPEAEKLRMLRNYGQEKRYYHKIKGFNSRLDEVQAAILRVKLKYLEGWNDDRRAKAGTYTALLAGLEGIATPQEAAANQHVYHLYVIRCRKRDELQADLKASGVETLIHYPVPVHRQASYLDLGYGQGTFPVAETKAGHILSLPIYPEMAETELRYVANKINDFVSRGN